jgi:hypothetical protein
MTNAIAQSPWKLPVLLSLLLLVPGVGLAAEGTSPSPEPLPGMAPREPLHLVKDHEQPRTVPHSNPVLRVAAEIGVEMLTALLVGLPSALVGNSLCHKFDLSSGYSPYPCDIYAAYGFATGVTLSAPLGVWLGGKLANGQGTLLGAYLGAGVGALLGLGAMVALTNTDARPTFIPLFSMVGAIIGYEVSHHSEASAAVDASLARVQPVLAVSAHGGALGLGGRF